MLKLGVKIKFSINDEDFFYLEGRFNDHILRKASFPDLVKEISPVFQSITDVYHDAMHDDGRLLGQEKIKLQELLDIMFYIFLAIRLHLISQGGKLKSHFTSYLDEEHPKFNYSEVDTGFQLSGKMTMSRVNKIKTFENWYNYNFSRKVKYFLSELKTSWMDKRLSQEETEKLICSIDSLLYSLIIIHFKLKIGKITL